MVELTPQLTLAVGDRVVYPNQGVCIVESVESKEVAGQTLTFVMMRREEDGAKVMVPTTKIQSIGLRKVANPQDVAKIFSFLKSSSDKTDLDWKQRARSNLDRMTQGGIRGLAEVVKGLQVLSELRPLPGKERELYDNARHLLVSELSAGLDIPPVDAEDAIDIVLFPPGQERPKRTAAEFKPAGSDEESLGLADDLLSIGGEVVLAPQEEGDAGDQQAETAQSAEEQQPRARKAREPKAGGAKPKKRAPGKPEPKSNAPKAKRAKPRKEAEPKRTRARPRPNKASPAKKKKK
jgi:RNA polymerase-interacting CarD/CdnL/TRCF family regulator